ncbi:hypothetical protein ACFLVN_05655 [Chloroflexota bacterium]
MWAVEDSNLWPPDPASGLPGIATKYFPFLNCTILFPGIATLRAFLTMPG